MKDGAEAVARMCGKNWGTRSQWCSVPRTRPPDWDDEMKYPIISVFARKDQCLEIGKLGLFWLFYRCCSVVGHLHERYHEPQRTQLGTWLRFFVLLPSPAPTNALHVLLDHLRLQEHTTSKSRVIRAQTRLWLVLKKSKTITRVSGSTATWKDLAIYSALHRKMMNMFVCLCVCGWFEISENRQTWCHCRNKMDLSSKCVIKVQQKTWEAAKCWSTAVSGSINVNML